MTEQAASTQPGEEPGRSAVTPTPLQRLIADRLREQNWRYADVARQGGLPESAVQALATRPNRARPPRPATLDALARGLEVPLAVVRKAAAESAGLYYYGSAGADSPRPGGQ